MKIFRNYSYKTKSSSPSGDFIIWIASLCKSNEIAIIDCDIEIKNGLDKITNALKEFIHANASIESIINDNSSIIKENYEISNEQLLSIGELINHIPKKFKYRNVAIKIRARWSESEKHYEVIFELKNILRAIGRHISLRSLVSIQNTDTVPEIPQNLNNLLQNYNKHYPLEWIIESPISNDTIYESSKSIEDSLMELIDSPMEIPVSSLENSNIEHSDIEYSSALTATFKKHGFSKSRHSHGMGVSGYEFFTKNSNRILIECIYSHLYNSIQFPIIWDVFGGKGAATLYILPHSSRIRTPYPFGNMEQVNTIINILDYRLNSIKTIIENKIDTQFGKTPEWYFK